MSDTQQGQAQPHLLLTITLIVLETIFTFILKHDRVVALQAKKFVDQKIALKINSYIPYFEFYVQFTEHGILFDTKSPSQAIDLDVRTTLMDLVKIFVFVSNIFDKKYVDIANAQQPGRWLGAGLVLKIDL